MANYIEFTKDLLELYKKYGLTISCFQDYMIIEDPTNLSYSEFMERSQMYYKDEEKNRWVTVVFHDKNAPVEMSEGDITYS